MQAQASFRCRITLVVVLTLLVKPSYGQSNGGDLLDFLPSILSNIVDNDFGNGAEIETETPEIPTVLNPTDLCEGFLVNDKSNRPMTSLAKPTPLATYTDPVFDSKVTRISNADAISSGVVRTLYSTIQAWNADESRMVLWHRGEGHYLYHGKTYELIEKLNVVPADIEQIYWSTTDPDVFVYPNQAIGSFVATNVGDYRLKGNELIEYNVSTKLYRVLKDFNSICTGTAGITSGDDVQMPSHDGDLFGLRCGELPFTYRVSSDEVTMMPDAVLSATQKQYAPMAFPSGERSYHFDTVRGANLQVERTFNLGKPNEHASLGRLHNGNDAYFATGFDATTDGSCDDGIGSLVVNDATNSDCQVLVGPGNGYPYTLSGTHISALAQQNLGWAVVSSIGYSVEGDSLLEQELYLANTDLDDLQVCRIAHHRSTGKKGSVGYFAEPHPVLSPTGTRVLFNSDWNNSGKVDVYVVELPVYN